MWDSFQTLAIIVENLAFYAFETLAVYVKMCLRMYALARIRRLRATLIILFPKKDFCSFKSLCFSILTLLKST